VEVNAPTTTAYLYGLTRQSYTFTVSAISAAGEGPASAPSNAVTPTVLPGAPRNVVATVTGLGEVTVTWEAPADDGGNPITQYAVTILPSYDHVFVDGTTFTATLTGLTHESHSFAVQAYTVSGYGNPGTSNAVTPNTLPDSPTGVSAVPGHAQATVSWTAPTNDGGAALTGYTVTASPGGASVMVDALATSATLGALSNDVAYTFTVVASSSLGDSATSEPSIPVTPFGAADATVSTIRVLPEAAFASGHDPLQLEVILRDAAGTPVYGEPVTIASSEPTDVLSTFGGTTDRAGRVRLEVTGTTVGVRTFTASSADADVTGSGSFVAACASGAALSATLTPFSPGSTPVALAKADLNEDGVWDLLSANLGNPGLGVLLGNGDGTFTLTGYDLGVSGPGSFANTADAVTAGDFDGDGHPDVAVIAHTPFVYTLLVFRGNGDGTLDAPVQVDMGSTSSSSTSTVSSGDLDQDGLDELAVTYSYGSTAYARIVRGSLDGSFTALPALSLGSNYSSLPSPGVLADATGDGVLDLVVANVDNRVAVLPGNGDGTFQSSLLSATAIGYAMAAADFDHDGALDVVVDNRYGDTLSTLFGVGDGTFGTPVDYAYETDSEPWAVIAPDLDGDGWRELVTADEGTQAIGVRQASGSGAWSSSVAEIPVGVSPVALLAADVTGDGVPELIYSEQSANQLHVLTGACQ
jgi:hypothetical protein